MFVGMNYGSSQHVSVGMRVWVGCGVCFLYLCVWGSGMVCVVMCFMCSFFDLSMCDLCVMWEFAIHCFVAQAFLNVGLCFCHWVSLCGFAIAFCVWALGFVSTLALVMAWETCSGLAVKWRRAQVRKGAMDNSIQKKIGTGMGFVIGRNGGSSRQKKESTGRSPQ